MREKIRAIVWNEFVHENRNEAVRRIYPEGIHGAIAGFLGAEKDLVAGTATMDQPEHGLTEERLADCDVLVWWSHLAHGSVSDEVADRVKRRVLEGMGFIALHSSHFSKVLLRLLGTNCSLKWREADDKERLWVVEPGHPIAAGLGEYFELPCEEMYGERFDIPKPESIVFISWFEGGEVFRSGCCWERGHGRIFYFRPGHETYPTYHDENVKKVIVNAVRWAAPRVNIKDSTANVKVPIEAIKPKPGRPAKA